MTELFRIPRVALPTLTRRSVSVALAGLIVMAVVITPGVSSALKVFTFQKAAKISLGNTNTITQAGTATPETVTPMTITCPAGHQATGGGADSPALAASGSPYPWLWESVPVAGGAKSVGWYVEVYNAFTTAQPFTAYAICTP